MPMSDPVDSTGPLMKGDDERTPGKLVTLRDVGHTFHWRHLAVPFVKC